MTLETFFKKFKLVADAPNAVTRMRGLVLSLTFQGKLLEQEARDESGPVLFDRISTQSEMR